MPSPASPQEPQPGFPGRVKRFFLGDKLDKEKLAQLGMGAFASYVGVPRVVSGASCARVSCLSTRAGPPADKGGLSRAGKRYRDRALSAT